MRGKVVIEKITRLHMGSPPPMRGKAHFKYFSKSKIRITPAYAGKRLGYARLTLGVRDHPRLCGEKLIPILYRCGNRGSPPPMRGKAPYYAALTLHIRITPAYAGKSIPPDLPQPARQDHPRLCGEKCGGQVAIDNKTGSPPPMRGKAWAEAKAPADERITPAYAGKSKLCKVRDIWAWDHPRLCGEK